MSDTGCIGVIGNWVYDNWYRGFVELYDDTIVSLMNMVSYARSRFHGAVIGVTGFVGKITTKTMIALVLESVGNQVYQIPGN